MILVQTQSKLPLLCLISLNNSVKVPHRSVSVITATSNLRTQTCTNGKCTPTKITSIMSVLAKLVYAANVQSVSRTHLSNLINKTAKTEKITNAEIHHITKSDIKMKQFSDTHLKYHHLGHNHRTYDI